MPENERSTSRPFLTARWEDLLLLNYRCPESLLHPSVPPGTELDLRDGEALVSIVGFRFLDTRIRGWPVPFHRNFEEINLRFYVRRTVDGELRRGVVFLREIVPRPLVAVVARWSYGEPYRSVPMDHAVDLDTARGGSLHYTWRWKGTWGRIAATASGPAQPLESGSAAEFITEHYWGYSVRPNGSTTEYRVEHEPWSVWTAETATLRLPNDSGLYGPELSRVLQARPHSAFVATGGPVSVFPGRPLGDP